MQRPNFIIIYCDDLGYGDLGCYGSEHVKTPHLDKLAGDGIRFTHLYSNSPVCSPSRASLLTGKYPKHAGVTSILGGKRGTEGLPADQPTLASRLKACGYDTAMFGKWHLGMTEENSPNAHGFDQFYGFKAGCVDYYSHIFYWGQGGGVNPVHDLWENQQEVWRDGEYLTEVITEKATHFIASRKDGDKPFFLYIPYNAPHYPMHAPAKYMERFSHLPWDRQVMAAMISAVDDGVGEIVQSLKQQGLYEDTVIFFSSDNGPSTEVRNWLDGTEDLYYGSSAGRFRGHKGSLFDGGIREPAIMCYPRVLETGKEEDRLAVMMDIVPTFMEWAGAPLEQGETDGTSLVTCLTHHETDSPHDLVFWEYGKQLAVRQGEWKLVLNGKLDFGREAAEPVHLSNITDDPGERINRADEHPELVQTLRSAAEAWLHQ